MEKPVEQSAIISEPLSSTEYGLHRLNHSRGENREDSNHELMAQASAAEVMDDPMPHRKECTAATRKELAPLVAMPPTSKAAVTNRLSKQTYSRLGRNVLFEAKPAVVHFSGFSIGKPRSQRVKVVNISRTSQRLHIFGPSTDCFKIRCNKKGMIAPGCSEAITIDFHPREYRYHYDCVRLHTGSDNLLIPVHAYPVMNNVVFPTRLDFGAHALGETVSRTVKISCKVPIQFEYEIQVTKPHPHFQVEPRRGIIPANGQAAVCIQHTAFNGSTAAMELLVRVSQFNFKPIVCVVTGAGRPGEVRQSELEAAASRLGKTILHDSLGRAAHENRNARRRTSARRENGCVRSRTGTLGSKSEKLTSSRRPHGNDFPRGDQASEGSRSIELEPCHDEDGRVAEESAVIDPSNSDRMDVTEESAALVDTWATRPIEADHCPYGTGKGSGAVFDAGGQWLSSERRMAHGVPHECWEPPTGGRAFGSIIGPESTTLVEGLVIPFRLDTVQSTNLVLTQKPGKLKPKDLKEAIRRIRADRARQLFEQEALRALTAPLDEEDDEILAGSTPGSEGGDSHTGDMKYKNRRGMSSCLLEGRRVDDGYIEDFPRRREGDVDVVTAESTQVRGSFTWQSRRMHQPAQMNGRSICAYERAVLGIYTTPNKGGGDSSYERNGTAARKRKEIFFLQDLATTEEEERERSFKASVEHIGEPLLPTKDIQASRFERERCQLLLQQQRKEEERTLRKTCLKGPHEVGERFARASLLLNGEGTQGVGFHHVPDWDLFKNDDWEKRREVLSRLVFLVGRWIARRRAAIRLKAIQVRLRGLQSKEEVAALVEQDNHQAKLAAGPRPNASQDSWQSTNSGSEDDGWNFPDPLVTSRALAVEMIAESTMAATLEGVRDGSDAKSKWFCSGLLPPPPAFCLSAGDVHRQRFPIYEEGAAVTWRTEDVDESGPPMDFVDVELLPLREPEEAKMMGYTYIRPPELGTYPSIEKNRVLRWSAFEECGVRQPRDEGAEDGRDLASLVPNGWRQALSTTERRQSKASFGRRRSSVGLRMTSTTAQDPDEAWLQEAEAELTELAAEAEKVERIPDSLLRCPPPPTGVDLITPDPRFKAYLPELPMDEASPAWCLRPQKIDREVPVTKGMVLGYSPGSTTLRAYAESPRLSSIWRPQRERRASGLTCMKGQASRGVWQPLRDLSYGGYGRSLGDTTDGTDGGSDGLKRSRYATGGIDHGFRLAPEAIAAAAAAGDELSDSESDDGESSLPIPTLASARKAFVLETRSAGDERPNSNIGAESKITSGCTNETRFTRDEAMATLEDTWRAKRETDAEVLVNRMGVIAAEVQNIKHAFVLQTPYHCIIRAEKPQGE